MIFRTQTTGIHILGDTLQWSTLLKTNSGIEKRGSGQLSTARQTPGQTPEPFFTDETLKEIRNDFSRTISVALPTSQLLLKVIDLPSTDAEELNGMVELQMDSISPFPLDQLSISYELLQSSENESRVIAVAAPRKVVDELGDRFLTQQIHIRSLDATVLAWWSQLACHPDTPRQGRALIFLLEPNEFSVIAIDDGCPIAVRSLHLFSDFSQEGLVADLVQELRYTLLGIETEYGMMPVESAHIWSDLDTPKPLADAIKQEFKLSLESHRLRKIAPLAESLAQRAIDRTANHAELVPREWVELQRRKRFMRLTAIGSAITLVVWILLIGITSAVFGIQRAAFANVEEQARELSGPARAAQAARNELSSLQKYADRSRSALECLREVTLYLPSGTEISSLTYTKGKAVRLTGTGQSSDPIYDYFDKLGSGDLFQEVKDSKITAGKRFTIQAVLPKIETEESE